MRFFFYLAHLLYILLVIIISPYLSLCFWRFNGTWESLIVRNTKKSSRDLWIDHYLATLHISARFLWELSRTVAPVPSLLLHILNSLNPHIWLWNFHLSCKISSNHFKREGKTGKKLYNVVTLQCVEIFFLRCRNFRLQQNNILLFYLLQF